MELSYHVRLKMAAPHTAPDLSELQAATAKFRQDYLKARAQIQQAIVGHQKIIDGVLTCLFAGGHALLEGVPGLGKTLLIRSLASALHLSFSRIQFTPDLMPADVTGTTIVIDTEQGRQFKFRRGPIFAQIVLADEINRATPKTQSALLEAMQEQTVTVGGETHKLDAPFFVMATQNPIEQEGTYPLPEAQLDRFFFKIIVPYATRDEMNEIVDRTTADVEATVEPILDSETILRAQRLARRIVVAPHVQSFAVRLTLSTHPSSPFADPKTDKYISVGVSPRGAQALICAAKVMALIDGRYAIAFHDVEAAAVPAFRHRTIRSFEAEADGVTTDAIIERLLEYVPREQ